MDDLMNDKTHGSEMARKMRYTSSKKYKTSFTNKKRTLPAAFLGMTLLMIAVILVIIDPVLIIAKFYTRIATGTYIHKLLQADMDSIHISAYLFNVTNADSFLSGDDYKLKVNEVGPFTYREIRINKDIEIDDVNQIMRYTADTKVSFLPDESIGDPEAMNVTMPNIAMLSMSSMISKYSIFPRMAYNLLAYRLKTKSIVRMSAYDYLWGYDDPLITLGNTVLPGWIHFDRMGILDRLFDKKSNLLTEVNARNSDKFMIETVDGVQGLKAWGFDSEVQSKCNSFKDSYEAIGYPPELTPERQIRIYRPVLCRFLDLDYHGKITMDYGVEGFVYKISNKTFTKNPDTECLCSRGLCIEGLSDLSPCFYDLPLALSNAHFKDADPKLFKRIEGMKPNEKDHGSAIIIDPKVGAALVTSFAVQVNVVMRDVSFDPETSKFSDMVVPIAYFRINQPKIPDQQVYDLRMIYVTGPYILLAIQIVLFSTSSTLLTYSLRVMFWNWKYSERKGIAFLTMETDKPKILRIELPLIS